MTIQVHKADLKWTVIKGRLNENNSLLTLKGVWLSQEEPLRQRTRLSERNYNIEVWFAVMF